MSQSLVTLNPTLPGRTRMEGDNGSEQRGAGAADSCRILRDDGAAHEGDHGDGGERHEGRSARHSPRGLLIEHGAGQYWHQHHLQATRVRTAVAANRDDICSG